MNSDRNLMQFVFNHPSILIAARVWRFGYVGCLCFVLVTTFALSVAHGQKGRQAFSRGFQSTQPRDFGDTPSPTEMMARLKFHKEQETPLFDLLREAGVDIFSKLSDDEKKLAGRFVEDMILKEGIDSEKVSSLMEHMNINDAAKQALQDGIERAGGGDSAISPEERKTLANKIRQQFLQKSDDVSDEFKSAANRNWQQNGARDYPDWLTPHSQAENGPSSRTGNESTGAAKPPKSIGQQIDEAIKEIERQQTQARRSDPTRSTGSTPGRELAGNGDNRSSRFPSPQVPQFRQPETQPNNESRPRNDSTTSPSNPATTPESQSLSKRLAQEAFRQLESNLSQPQREVVSEFKNKIQNGDVSGQEIGELFDDLQSAQSARQFAERLDDVGEEIGLPAESRNQVQEAFRQLSGEQRESLQRAFSGADKKLLSNLLDDAERGQPSDRPSGASSQGSASASGAGAGRAGSFPIEDLGREFLQDALKTYNDPESGYELSDAFKRLKDQAEGVNSGRELADLGSLSKQLFENSSGIFDGANSASEERRKNGLKPGQRLDQLLTSAAKKSLANNQNSGADEGDSVFGDVLNKALGVAIDQAVTAADKDLENGNLDVAESWNPAAPGPPNSYEPTAPYNYPENSNGFDPFDSTDNPANNDSANNSNPATENLIQDSAASFTDMVSKMKFNWQAILYGVLIIALLTGAIYWLSRLMQPVSKAELQQRELQLKLKNRSANPKDLVEAVDLFLLSRFGSGSSWWNANHAATQVSNVQPDWRDKVASLFQVYRWSRYQPDGDTLVSPEQNEQVKSTLRELSEVPVEAFDKTKSSKSSESSKSSAPSNARSVVSDAEGES